MHSPSQSLWSSDRKEVHSVTLDFLFIGIRTITVLQCCGPAAAAPRLLRFACSLRLLPPLWCPSTPFEKSTFQTISLSQMTLRQLSGILRRLVLYILSGLTALNYFKQQHALAHEGPVSKRPAVPQPPLPATYSIFILSRFFPDNFFQLLLF